MELKIVMDKGRIISTYVLPHPPIIVPEVGKGSEALAAATIAGMHHAADAIKKDNPSVIILTTPHAPVFQDYIYISGSPNLSGSLERFGAGNVKLNFINHQALVERIAYYSSTEDIPAGSLTDSMARRHRITRELDHGAIVPLYFISKKISSFKIVHISIAGLPLRELYLFGICISKAVRDSGERAVFVASGDLSHRLSHDAPYGYSPRGREFDELIISSFENLNVTDLLDIDQDLCENAGECGLRSFVIMFGAVDGFDLKSEVYSHEGPFGVGYATARFGVGDERPERQILKKYDLAEERKIDNFRGNESPYVTLARKALELYIKEEKILKVPEDLPPEMYEKRAGTFVSLKKYGQLRGCIGTTGPTKSNIAEEIIHNAISAGARDPRFNPVECTELDKLVYSVDILSEPEAINSVNELDVMNYGVIVSSGGRVGLLLPNLEGVDTPQKQVSIALQKAGIRQDEKYNMQRFEVTRHK